MNRINQLNVKLFADGADLDSMLALYKRPYIRGFTTNPTLVKKAGIKNYEKFAKQGYVIVDSGVSKDIITDTQIAFKKIFNNFTEYKLSIFYCFNFLFSTHSLSFVTRCARVFHI